jgi:hypothetical protein
MPHYVAHFLTCRKGIIAEDSVEELRALVAARHIVHARIHFNSAGGSLIGGLRLGHLIRQLGFETEVKASDYEYDKGPVAICASACAYAFAGGVDRFYDDRVGKLGLHQFYHHDPAAITSADAQRVTGLLINYLNEMGVDARSLAIASLTSKDAMSWLRRADAETVKLATNGSEPTTAEIKLSDGKPYLRLEQNFSDVTSRVLVLCNRREISLMAGIVTTEEFAREQIGFFGYSYLEFDSHIFGEISGGSGAEVQGSVIWLSRDLDAASVKVLRSADNMGIWLHNKGAMRWGGQMELSGVRAKLVDFIDNCRAT